MHYRKGWVDRDPCGWKERRFPAVKSRVEMFLPVSLLELIGGGQPMNRMNGSTDQQLLRDYAERRSEAAFAELGAGTLTSSIPPRCGWFAMRTRPKT